MKTTGAFSAILGVALLGLSAGQEPCKDSFGFEMEFAYIGETHDSFYEDSTDAFEVELSQVLQLVASTVSQYNDWSLSSNVVYSKRYVGGDNTDMLELTWVDIKQRTWKVSQESVGGRLYDGLEVVSPIMDDAAETKTLLEAFRAAPFLAQAPDSGIHIWVDASCLDVNNNAYGIAHLLVAYEDFWSTYIQNKFHSDPNTQRRRFWRSYKECNPKLLADVRKMLKNDFISREMLRAAFMQNQREELDCLHLRSLPEADTRQLSKVWRYKGVNVASSLNLTPNYKHAVEFRAWDFMDADTMVEAIELSRLMVRYSAQTGPLPMKKWKGVTRDEMRFNRNLQSDPKDVPTTSPTVFVDCESFDGPESTRDERKAACQAAEASGCVWSGLLTGLCKTVNVCEDWNKFPVTNTFRRSGCEDFELNCEYIDSQCLTPLPTASPTPEPPTTSPVTSAPTPVDCLLWNDGSSNSKATRKAACQAAEESDCVWSGLDNGYCYEVTTCEGFNQFKVQNSVRRNYCQDSDLACDYQDNLCFSTGPTASPTPSPPTTSPVTSAPVSISAIPCEDHTITSTGSKEERKARCQENPTCLWSGLDTGICHTVTECADINNFPTQPNSIRRNFCLGSTLNCEFASSTCSDAPPTASPVTSEPTAAPVTSAPTPLSCEAFNGGSENTREARKTACQAATVCEWSGLQDGLCYEITECGDYNSFPTQNSVRRNYCLDSETLNCDFASSTCFERAPTATPTTSAPTVFTCEQITNMGGAKLDRKETCEEFQECEWIGLNSGACFTVENCSDYNDFPLSPNAIRRTRCLGSDLGCDFASGECFDLELLPAPPAPPIDDPAPTPLPDDDDLTEPEPVPTPLPEFPDDEPMPAPPTL